MQNALIVIGSSWDMSLAGDVLFTAGLLGASVMLAAGALWLALCLRLGAWAKPKISPGVYRVGPVVSTRKYARAALGSAALACGLLYMLGMMPGVVPMPGATALAACATVILSLLVLGGALTDRAEVSWENVPGATAGRGRGETLELAPAARVDEARKAA